MMMGERHFFTDASASGYLEQSQSGQYHFVKATHTLYGNRAPTVIGRARDAVIAKGELLKANIARMREERKRKY